MRTCIAGRAGFSNNVHPMSVWISSGGDAGLHERDDAVVSAFDHGMTVGDGTGFTTVSSSLVALPGPDRFGDKPIWLFCAGAPDQAPYEPVDLS